MKQEKIITRRSIIPVIEDYLADKKSLDDLEHFASNILFIDEEIGEKSRFDPQEDALIRASVWFLHETELPWNSYINKVDLKFLCEILTNVQDQESAIDLIYILEYRMVIGELIVSYLTGKLSDNELREKIKSQNIDRAIPLLIKLIYDNRENKETLSAIISDLNMGKVDRIAKLMD